MGKKQQPPPASTPKDNEKPAQKVSDARVNLLGVIVPAVLGLIGVIITAYYGYLGIRMQIERPAILTQTAEARLTALAQTVTMTATLIPVPSATPTIPSPVNTVLQTPTGLSPAETATPTLFYRGSLTPATSVPTSIPMTPLPFETFFQECRSNTFASGNGSININLGCVDAEGKPAIQLLWKAPYPNSYAGCTVSLEFMQPAAGANQALVLWVRGSYDNERMAIKLKDAALEQEKLITLSTGWQQVILPLWSDFPDLDAGELKELTMGIAYDPDAISRNGAGSACLSNIGFGSP
jgi:hypothetical protein